ncbi:hypothetical protein NUW54_g14721 [Trametes sanguinea]|uniref:Uncharacterized protein n=1 Tax=Trametes sanguinea TaxID=158606 RepID=A0ACC1MAK6_9APHY|nr:hypothetical protein NUW54_g14721 [Trametes sanguinea]
MSASQRSSLSPGGAAPSQGDFDPAKTGAQYNPPRPPPGLVNLPTSSAFDPANMPWKSLEVSPTDLGIIRLAGKDVDLFKLWQLIIQAGGGQKVRSPSSLVPLLVHGQHRARPLRGDARAE